MTTSRLIVEDKTEDIWKPLETCPLAGFFIAKTSEDGRERLAVRIDAADIFIAWAYDGLLDLEIDGGGYWRPLRPGERYLIEVTG